MYLRENPKGVFRVVDEGDSDFGDLEIPEGTELIFTNECDKPNYFVFAKEDDGVVFIQHKKVSDWCNTTWDGLLDIKECKSNTVIWEKPKETSVEELPRIKTFTNEVDLLNGIWNSDVMLPESFSGEFEYTLKPIKSDGGSSSYYFSKLPQHLIDDIVKRGGIEIKDIVRYCFDNDADCKDIIKALKRIRENLKGGGKDGVDVMYDANKVCFFAEELKTHLKMLGEYND